MVGELTFLFPLFHCEQVWIKKNSQQETLQTVINKLCV